MPIINGKRKFHIKELMEAHDDCDIYIVFGGKNIGKSYGTKEMFLERAWDTRNDSTCGKFIYMRRWAEDIKRANVEMYFNGGGVTKLIKKITNGECDCITVYSKKIYFSNHDKNGKVVRKYLIGYTMAMTAVEHEASLVYENVEMLLYEEWQTTERYLTNEPTNLRRLINTVERDGKIKVIMLANTISRVCPYVADWSLERLPMMKRGDTDIYDVPTGAFDENGRSINNKILCHYCSETDMAKGFQVNGKKDMISAGHFMETLHATFKYTGTEQCYHTLVVEYDGFKFLMRLLNNGTNLFWYVERKTTEMKPNTRIVGNVWHNDPLYTKSFMPLSQAEANAFRLLKAGHIAFADNLTGTEFDTALMNIGINLS